MTLLPLTLFAIGCGSTMSNAVFYDDADFLNALPGAGYFHLSYPTEFDTSDCDLSDSERSLFACITVDSLATGDELMGTITGLTQVVRTLAPSERGDDYRVWGPGDWLEFAPGTFLLVEMSRSPTHSAYSWAFQLAPSSQGPWESEFIHGTHYAGEIDVAAGIGDLVLDLDVLAEFEDTSGGGIVTVDYDVRELTRFSIQSDVGDGVAVNSEWVYEETEEGGGDFTLDTEVDVNANANLEQMALRSRWEPEGQGRGDALLHGGDLTGNPLSASQCWAADGTLSWHFDDLGWIPETGDIGECAFEDAAFPALETEG